MENVSRVFKKYVDKSLVYNIIILLGVAGRPLLFLLQQKWEPVLTKFRVGKQILGAVLGKWRAGRRVISNIMTPRVFFNLVSGSRHQGALGFAPL